MGLVSGIHDLVCRDVRHQTARHTAQYCLPPVLAPIGICRAGFEKAYEKEIGPSNALERDSFSSNRHPLHFNIEA
jgi:hypothetical protein